MRESQKLFIVLKAVQALIVAMQAQLALLLSQIDSAITAMTSEWNCPNCGGEEKNEMKAMGKLTIQCLKCGAQYDQP